MSRSVFSLSEVGDPRRRGRNDPSAHRLLVALQVGPNLARLGPGARPVDPAARLIWLPGDAAQCDLWFPPKKIPLEDGSRTLLPVLVITAAHSRFMVGRMIPTRHTVDLLLGMWILLQTGLVFTSEVGSPVARSTLQRTWRIAAKKVGTEATPHDYADLVRYADLGAEPACRHGVIAA